MSTEPVLWYYAQGTERRGPVTDDKLAQLVALGEVTPETLLWNASLPAWVAARTVFATPPPLSHSPAATAPVSVPVAQPQGQTPVAPVTVKKMSVFLLLVLTVVSFGFYYNVWFLKRREELNGLHSKRKLSGVSIVVSLLAKGAFVLLSLLAVGGEIASPFYLLDCGCLLFAAVRVANMIDDHCRTMGRTSNVRSGFAGCGVIFFGAFWLQHCINKYLRSEGDDEEISFFPKTMKTPNRVGLGSLAVLGVLFFLFVVAGVISKVEPESSPETQNGAPSEAPRRLSASAPPAPTSVNDAYLTQALLRLRMGGSIESLRGCAYRGAPNFVVDNIVDDWVIYEFSLTGDEPNVQFAVERQPGEYYGAGQRMREGDYYEITGSGAFKTVLDQTRMIPVGRRADPSLRHCQR